MTIVNRFSKAQVLCILFILWTLISINEFQCISHFFTKVFISSLTGHSLLWAGPQLLYQNWYAAGEEKFLIRVPSIEEFFKPFTFSILQNKLCKSLSEAKFLSRTPKLQPQHWWFPGKWCCYIPGFQVSKKEPARSLKHLQYNHLSYALEDGEFISHSELSIYHQNHGEDFLSLGISLPALPQGKPFLCHCGPGCMCYK